MHELCAKSAVELARLLAAKEVSSVELARAHLERIEQVDARLRAYTQLFRAQALADAERSDAERRRGALRGPLHGLPVSIKESLDVAGLAATMGVASRRALRAAANSALVQALREAGAVPLGRTNVSQYLIFHESRNPLFGQTANPWSRAHTPGGSSGGEAAALAAGLSPLGFGTDIGGSIRVPAHFSGIAGFKPTLDRWPNQGAHTALAGQEAVRGQTGPMARTVDDLALAFRALDPVRLSELDARVPPLPFRDPAEIDVRALRIGWYTEDGFVRASAAVARALSRAAALLREYGCAVRPFAPPGIRDAVLGFYAALSADGGAMVQAGLAGGAVDPVLARMRRIARLPPAARRSLAWLLAHSGEEKVAALLAVTHAKSVEAFWRLTSELRAYRVRVLEALRAAEIDILLCPAHATPALPHGMSKDFPVAGSASQLFNVLQFPAGVVPMTRVRADELERPAARDRLERHAAQVDRASLGLPVGVQVVAPPWHDERALAVMKVLEHGVAQDDDVPRTPVDPS